MTIKKRLITRIASIFVALALIVGLVPVVPGSSLVALAVEAADPIAAAVPVIPRAADMAHVHNMPGWECESELKCEKEEHKHSDECDKLPEEPTCGQEEHVHDQDCYRCTTEFSLLTVEYFMDVNGQLVRSGDTYQSLQAKDSPYKVSIEDLSAKGYAFSQAQGWLRDGDEAKELAADGADDDAADDADYGADNGFVVSGEGTDMYVTGTLKGDTLIRVFYEYTEALAPYQGYYYGGAATGESDVLLYSYISYGIKDTTVEMENDITTLVTTMLEVLDSEEVKRTQSGAEFVKALVECVSKKYGENLVAGTGDNKHEYLRHDITPLLRGIAESLGDDHNIDNLTRTQVKQYMTDVSTKHYGLDLNRGSGNDNKVKVTADGDAKKYFYYIEGTKISVTFITGTGSAKVTDIPDSNSEAMKPQPDADGVITDYGIVSEDNRIVAYSGVDISAYTKNIAATSGNYKFIGWHTDTDFGGAILDYSESSEQYKSLDLITMAQLAEKLKTMPSVNTSYYAVWTPLSATYTVQLWFETEVEGVYQESHAYDMFRTGKMGTTVKYNDFDKKRADETDVVKAANGNASFPVKFEDSGEGASGTTDTYYTWSDYTNGVFYGYDLLDDGKEPTKFIDQNGNEIDMDDESKATTGNTKNGEEVSIREDGQTVLNVFYKREVWTIKVHPAIEIYQYSEATDYMSGADKLFTNGQGGRLLSDIAADFAANDTTTAITFEGRFGTQLTTSSKDKTGNYTFGSLFSPEVSVDINATDKTANTQFPYPGEYYIAEGNDVTFTSFANQSTSNTSDYGKRTKTFDHDVKMNYQGLTTLAPSMFAKVYQSDNRTKDEMFYMYDSQNTTTFGYESNYKLDGSGSLTAVQYGTHTLDVYPHYLNAESSITGGIGEQTFYVDYYVQTLPDNSDNTKGLTLHPYDGANFVKYGVEKETDHTVTFQKNAWMSTYTVEVPEGFTALAWRAGTASFNGDSFDIKKQMPIEAYWRNTNAWKSPSHTIGGESPGSGLFACKPQAMGDATSTVPVNYIYSQDMGYGAISFAYHDSGFNDDNIVQIGDTSFYTSDWMIRYEAHNKNGSVNVGGMDYVHSCARGLYDPHSIDYNTPDGYYNASGYWVTDFVRTSTGTAGLGGTLISKPSLPVSGSGLDNYINVQGHDEYLLNKPDNMPVSYEQLVKAAEEGDTDSQSLLAQLRDTVVVGNFYANDITTYYVSNSTSSYVFKLNGNSNNKNPGTRMNAVIFARNYHNINFYTCYVDGNGTLVRDDDGNIKMTKVHSTTEDTTKDDATKEVKKVPVYYDQPLTNYYSTYFTVDEDGSNPTFKGYGDAYAADAEGGYGKWYLDPDGTIPFTEENLAKMPDEDVNVYYHYGGITYDVYFVDDNDFDGGHPIPNLMITDPNFYGFGKPETINHVYDHQVVEPNGTATEPAPPSDDNYYFDGWYTDKDRTTPFDFDKEITEDTIVYAKWTPKVPTKYTIRHILVDKNGVEIKDVVEPFYGDGLVGQTVNANALDTEVYYDGMWFVPDFYSATMVLKEAEEANVLVFEYRLPEKSYTVHYVEKGTHKDIVDPDGPIDTTLASVTAKWKDLKELGLEWELDDDQYKTEFIPNEGHVDIYFEYIIPKSKPTPTPTTPTPTTPPELNKDDHYAYIIGYPEYGEDGLPLVKPQGNITRAEVVTIFFRMLTDDSRNEYWATDNPYPDVEISEWYNNAISTMNNGGVIDGYPDGSFQPDGSITRAELTKIAVSFFQYKDSELTGQTTFDDVDSDAWYARFIEAAAALDLITGYPDGTFRPDEPITRAEAVTLINRVLGRSPHLDGLLEDMCQWSDNLDPGEWYYVAMQEATNSHNFTVEESTGYEKWSEILERRDWAAFERMWSDANSAPNPGDVMK